MATFTLHASNVFPNGTSLGAYRAVDGVLAPQGSAIDTQTVASGVVTFTGLSSGLAYQAWGVVSGQYRSMAFITDAAVGAGLDTSADQTWTGDQTFEGAVEFGGTVTPAYIAQSDLDTHTADSTSVHGITNTANLLTTSSIGSTVASQTDTRLPVAGEKSALAGTSGTPGSGNKYVTDADSRVILDPSTITKTGVWTFTQDPVFPSQTQVSKVSSVSGDYPRTLQLTDLGKVLETPNDATDRTITIPLAATVAVPTNSIVEIYHQGSGTLTVQTEDNTIFLRYPGSNGHSLQVTQQFATIGLRCRASGSWVASGEIG